MTSTLSILLRIAGAVLLLLAAIQTMTRNSIENLAVQPVKNPDGSNSDLN